MSTTHDLHCRTCDVGAGFALQHSVEQLSDLWNERETFAALASAMERMKSADFELNISGDYNGGMRLFPAFARAHAHHDVAIRDGYGGFSDQCNAMIECESCKSSHRRCRLKLGHEGRCHPAVMP